MDNKNKMPMYIGTKLVQAEPMLQADYEVKHCGRTVVTPDVVREGYKVVYQDGSHSWSLKEVFEQEHRQVDGLSFGLAIEAAKMGKKIARKGWNGKGQYVVLGHDFEYSIHVDKDGHAAFHKDIGSKALVFVGTRGSQVGWLASQADMLADDWYIVEG